MACPADRQSRTVLCWQQRLGERATDPQAGDELAWLDFSAVESPVGTTSKASARA